MSNIRKFQLPPIRGTDVFPQEMQAPTVVHASVEVNVAPGDEVVAPQVLEDYSKQFIQNNLGEINNFLISQRRNFLNGIAEFGKTSRSTPAYDMSYTNIQNRQEMLTIHMRYDVRRNPQVAEDENDPLMLLVLYDTNKIAAILMSSLNNLATADVIQRTLSESSWLPGVQYYVHQLRLSDQYSVVTSELKLTSQSIDETLGSAFIVHDDPDSSLQASIDDVWASPATLNGVGTAFFTPDADYVYQPDGNIITLMQQHTTTSDAVSRDGQRYTDDTDNPDASIEYTNNIANWGTDRSAVDVVVAQAVSVRDRQTTTVTETGESTAIQYTYEGGDCGDRFVTITKQSSSGQTTLDYIASATWDGISLGSQSVVSRSQTSMVSYYASTEVSVYGPSKFIVVGEDPPGIPRSEYVTTSGGVQTIQSAGYGSSTSEGGTVTFPDCGECQDGPVSCLDYCARVPGEGCASWEATMGCADRQRAFLSEKFCGTGVWSLISCLCSITTTITNSSIPITFTSFSVVGDIGSAGLIDELPAVKGTKYHFVEMPGSEPQVITPYDSWSGQPHLRGYWNLANGEHLLQAYTRDDTSELHVYLDGQRIDGVLASIIGTDVNSIAAVYMDIHLSKVLGFN